MINCISSNEHKMEFEPIHFIIMIYITNGLVTVNYKSP